MSGAATGVFTAESSYLDRWVQVGIASGNVIRITFPDESLDSGRSHPMVERILAYLDGAEEDFTDVEIALTVPTDHRHVFETLRALPYGSDHTVKEIVAKTPSLEPGTESDERVRTALAANPIPIIIPDHRVVDADGPAGQSIRQKLRELENL